MSDIDPQMAAFGFITLIALSVLVGYIIKLFID